MPSACHSEPALLGVSALRRLRNGRCLETSPEDSRLALFCRKQARCLLRFRFERLLLNAKISDAKDGNRPAADGGH